MFCFFKYYAHTHSHTPTQYTTLIIVKLPLAAQVKSGLKLITILICNVTERTLRGDVDCLLLS